MRFTELLRSLLLFAACAYPYAALAQAGSGVRGEDPQKVRAGVLKQFIRADLAQEAGKYVRTFDFNQVPAELGREKEIFASLLKKGLFAESERFSFAPSKSACFDAWGKRACASAQLGKLDVPVCIDPDWCAEEYSYKIYDDETAKKFLVATVLHEKAHQYGFEEADAERVSAYVRRTVGLGPVAPPRTAPVSWAALDSMVAAPDVEREFELEDQRRRWRSLPAGAKKILEVCKTAGCQLAFSETLLPEAIRSLLQNSCTWPVLWRRSGGAGVAELFTGSAGLFFSREFWSLESWKKLGYELVDKLGPQDYDPRGEGEKALLPYNESNAFKCYQGALEKIQSSPLPGNIDELERYEIGVAQSACEGIDKDAFSEFYHASDFDFARDQCFARAASALSSVDGPSHLSKRRPHMRAIAVGCSLGKPERLSGSDRAEFSWPDVKIGTCYSKGFKFLLQPWEISLEEKPLRSFQIGLLIGSCQFDDPRKMSVMPYRSRADCLQKGSAIAGQNLNLEILAMGCRYEDIPTNSKAVAQCFEAGLSYLVRWDEPASPGDEADRYTIGMMLSAFTAPEKSDVREKMVRSALASPLIPKAFQNVYLRCAVGSPPTPCLTGIQDAWGVRR